MMRNRMPTVVLVSAVVLGCSLAPASARGSRSTAIGHVRPDGKVLVVATGTEDGECSALGGRILCHDGRSYAVADEDGCKRVTGGARCLLSDPERGRRELDPSLSDVLDPLDPGAVEAQESSIDIECEEGDKTGAVYTLSDSDATGTCSPQFGPWGRVTGGGCTKGGHQCTGVDCMHGCTGSSNNCQCRVKSGPKKPSVATQ